MELRTWQDKMMLTEMAQTLRIMMLMTEEQYNGGERGLGLEHLVDFSRMMNLVYQKWMLALSELTKLPYGIPISGQVYPRQPHTLHTSEGVQLILSSLIIIISLALFLLHSIIIMNNRQLHLCCKPLLVLNMT